MSTFSSYEKDKERFDGWRRYLIETDAEADAVAKIPMTWQVMNLQLQIANDIKNKKMSKEELIKKYGGAASEVKGLVIGKLIDYAATLIGPVGVLLKVGVDIWKVGKAMFKGTAQKPDEETAGTQWPNSALGIMNLKDAWQDLVDDKLEDEFVEYFSTLAGKKTAEGSGELIPDIDDVFQKWLANKDIQGEKGNTVTTAGGK